MYDSVRVAPEIELPDYPNGARRDDFQTKDLECWLQTYSITAARRLVRERNDGEITGNDGERDTEHHGYLTFYTSIGNARAGDYEWFEYRAKFTDGVLVSVMRHVSPGTNP